MKNKEADAIIKNYKPTNGFFDLSKKPDGLSKLEYAKILEAQKELVFQNNHRDYLKKNSTIQWEKLKEFSAVLQQLIFRYWGDSVFD